MKLEGDKNKYDLEVLNIKNLAVNSSQFAESKNIQSIFDAFSENKKDSSGNIETKNIFQKFSEIAKSNKSGSNEVLEDVELESFIKNNDNFKNFKLSDVKNFVAKFFNVSFSAAANDYCKTENLKQFPNTSKLASKTDPNNVDDTVYLLSAKDGKIVKSEKLNGHYMFYEDTGFYELQKDFMDYDKKNVIAKAGLYDNNGDIICSGDDLKNKTGKYIEALAKAHNLTSTENDNVYVNSDNKKYVLVKNNFLEVKDGDKLEYDKNSFSCSIKKYKSAYDKRDFYWENVYKHNGKDYESEAEYVIAKNNLNIKAVKENGKTTYVDAKNSSIKYDFEGGNFKPSLSSVVEKTKNKESKSNGKVDKQIYQGSIGDCYLVSVLQGMGENLGNLVSKKGNDYQVTFPGLDDNPSVGKKSYIISQSELDEAINANGKESLLGDQDGILLELAYKKFRKDVVNYLEKECKKGAQGVSKNDINAMYIKNQELAKKNPVYDIPLKAIESEYNPKLKDSLLSRGHVKSVLKLLMPKNTEINDVPVSKDMPPSKIIEKYGNDEYRIFASYVPNDGVAHGVAYDSKSKKFIDTYNPDSHDSKVDTPQEMDSYIKEITVVKVNKKSAVSDSMPGFMNFKLEIK